MKYLKWVVDYLNTRFKIGVGRNAALIASVTILMIGVVATFLLAQAQEVRFEAALEQAETMQVDADKVITPAILGVGIFLSSMAALLFYFVMMNRISLLSAVHEEKVQRTKDELLALASHQLRTPASGVKQYIGMVTQGYAGDITDEQREMLNKAYDANERQLDIINQLLYVAKADAGQLFLEPTSFNVIEVIEEAISNLEAYWKQRGITIKLTKHRPVMVLADLRYTRMIVENLLTNAIKYSHKDSRVEVRVVDGEEFVKFKVIDKGVGIAKDDIDQVFKKFSRVENELSRQVSGSGLGLFLTKRLIEAHGGDILVSSTPGKGSTFTALFPKQKKLEKSDLNYRNNQSQKVRLD